MPTLTWMDNLWVQILFRVLCVTLGYACGMIQTSYILGRIHHVDIRKHGSGNAGTTNTLRVFGKEQAEIVLLVDFMKAFIPCLLIGILFRALHQDYAHLMAVYAGVGVIAGHVFPAYMGFHGGKGIASLAGIIGGMMDWRIIFACLFTFIIIVAITKYVSLGSIVISAMMWIMHAIFLIINPEDIYHCGKSYVIECIIVLGFISALTIYKHHSNIVRLLHGEENKISFKKSESDEKKEG